MAKPRLIILIRHAQSEGNKNREIHQTTPDHRVKLTPEGWQQAYDAGRRLRAMLRADDTLHFFTSPYRRTRETTEGILSTLTSDDPSPSPFKRSNIKVYEEPRLREQDFGNFQPCSAEMERMWQERADYGHFFYRIPNGESAADAYDRISGFNESLWRQFGEDDFASVCVLVTHGLMSRIFLMKWYHFSVEYFEDLRNVGHCEFLIMRKQDSGKYKLENKLRTWSELRRQRELAYKEAAEKEAAEEGGEAGGSTAVAERPKDGYQLQRKMSTSAAPRRWGGCPNGCTHTMHYKPRRDLDELVSRDTNSRTTANGGTGSGSGSGAASPAPGATIATRRQYNAYGSRRVHAYNSEDDPDDPRGEPEKSNDGSTEAGSSNEKAGPRPIDTLKAREELVSSPDGTPSFITVEDRLRSQLRSPTMGLHSHSHHSSPHPSHHCHHRHHHHHSHACSRSRSVGGNSSTAHHDIMHLHVGRDGGGTYSGHASQDDYSSDSDHCHHDGTCGKDGEECRGAEVDIADAKQQLAAKAARVKAGSSRNKLALLTSSTAGVSSGNNGSTPTTAVLRGGHAGGVQDSDDGDVESFDDSRHQDISRARANRLGDAPLSSDIGSEGGDTGSVPDSPLSPRTTHASTLAVPLAVKPENKKKKKASMVVVAAADAAAGDCGNGSNAHDEAAHDAEDEEDEDDLVCVEREEKSVMGSVF